MQHLRCTQRTGMLGRYCAIDAGTIACHEQLVVTASAPLIGGWTEASLRLAPLMRQAQCASELRIGHDPLVQENGIAFQLY